MQTEKGFTLIETIIAVMVVAAATVMLVQIYSSVLKGGTNAADILRAVEIAQDNLEQMGTIHPLEPGAEGGVTPDGFHWQINVKPFGSGGVIALASVRSVVRKAGHSDILADLTTLKIIEDSEK